MSLSRERARRLLAPYYRYLFDSLVGGWSDFRRIPSSLRVGASRRTRASYVSDLILARAERNRPPGITVLPRKRGLCLFAIGKEAVLRFKKLRPDGTTSNIPTQQSIDFGEQRPIVQLWLPGLEYEPAHLNVGYVLNMLETEVAAIYVTCPVRGGLAWSINVIEEMERRVETIASRRAVARKGDLSKGILPFQIKKGLLPKKKDGEGDN